MWNDLVCVITVLFVTDVVVCTPDYIFDREVDGWLSLHPVPETWQEAFLKCRFEGAVLASPINPQLANALLRTVRKYNVTNSILTGVRALTKGDFLSIEGVPLTDLSITWGTFGDGQASGDILSMSTDGKTYISSLTSSLPYICYKKRDNTTVLNRCGTFDDDYHYYRATGSCYKLHKPKTWFMAHKICLAEGAHLVIINDEEEYNIVKEVMNGKQEAFIGFRDWNADHTWLTIHGQEIEDVYHTWAKGFPNADEGADCGDVWIGNGLCNVLCTSKREFVCEKDPNSSRFARDRVSRPRATCDVIYAYKEKYDQQN